MSMCVVYWSEIHQLKYQRGFIFNGFRPNSQRWKYAILTNIFYRIRICSFFTIWHEEDIIQQLKAWSFRMWKNLVNTQSNSETIARWSSIIFFWYTLYINTRREPSDKAWLDLWLDTFHSSETQKQNTPK
jgi:hypothetical protein